MKVTIYTINDCSFSKLEKEYLKANNIPFEEKNLEANREYLTEMLAISDNFAGTPVTKIEKDGSEAIIIKGFTKDEFDGALGINAQPQVQQVPVTPEVAPVPAQEPVQTAPTVAPTVPTPAPVVPQVPTAVESATNPPTEPSTEMADPTLEKDMSIQSLSEPMFDTAAPSPIKPMQTPGSVNPPVQQPTTNNQQPTTVNQQVAETPVVSSPPQSQEALDSVLQNLQSQVAEVEGEEEDKVPPTTV